MYSLHGDEFGRHAMLDMLQNSWLIGQVFDGWESGTQALFGDVMLFNATEEERRLAIGLCNHEATHVESAKLCFFLQRALFPPENIVQSIAVAFEHCALRTVCG